MLYKGMYVGSFMGMSLITCVEEVKVGSTTRARGL
jgi:hypothetical protein